MAKITAEQAIAWLKDDDVYWINRDITQFIIDKLRKLQRLEGGK